MHPDYPDFYKRAKEEAALKFRKELEVRLGLNCRKTKEPESTITGDHRTEPSFARATKEQLKQLIDLSLMIGDKEWFLELSGQLQAAR